MDTTEQLNGKYFFDGMRRHCLYFPVLSNGEPVNTNIMAGYHPTNRKIDTGKNLKLWPVFVDHFNHFITEIWKDNRIEVPGAPLCQDSCHPHRNTNDKMGTEREAYFTRT